MSVEGVLTAGLATLLVAGFSAWTGWRVMNAVFRQRRIELAWRERLAVWRRRGPEPPPVG